MWWMYVLVGAVLLFGADAFSKLAGFETRLLGRRTHRRAEDLHRGYGDQAKRRWLGR